MHWNWLNYDKLLNQQEDVKKIANWCNFVKS